MQKKKKAQMDVGSFVMHTWVFPQFSHLLLVLHSVLTVFSEDSHGGISCLDFMCIGSQHPVHTLACLQAGFSLCEWLFVCIYAASSLPIPTSLARFADMVYFHCPLVQPV